MGSEVDELCSFLEHERADVRQMAVEGIKTYTGSGEGLTLLLQVDGLLGRLVSMLGDGTNESTAAAAGAALVNISQEPAARVKLLNLGAVDAAAASASSDEAELVEMCLMLLANLTQFDRGRSQLLGEVSRPHLARLIETFSAAQPHTRRYDYLPLVLTHVCATPEGRAMLLLEHAPAVQVLAKLSLTASGELLHATAQSLRNLCFEAAEGTQAHSTLCNKLADELIVALTVRLTPPDADLDEEERAALSPLMREALDVVEQAVPREATEKATRLILTEAMLLLTASAELREQMRSMGVFPILRASLAAEEPFDVDPNNPVREANERLGALLVATTDGDKTTSRVKEVESEASPGGE